MELTFQVFDVKRLYFLDNFYRLSTDLEKKYNHVNNLKSSVCTNHFEMEI